MSNDSCAEKIDRIYIRLAWIMVLTGLIFVLKILAVLVPDWQAMIKTATPVLGLLISLSIIWTLGPSALKNLRGQNKSSKEPEGFVADMLQQALAVSWGVTLVGIVLVQLINQVFGSNQITAQLLSSVLFALMTLSASLTFLYLVKEESNGEAEEEWD